MKTVHESTPLGGKEGEKHSRLFLTQLEVLDNVRIRGLSGAILGVKSSKVVMQLMISGH
jgi:hypothetical protein